MRTLILAAAAVALLAMPALAKPSATTTTATPASAPGGPAMTSTTTTAPKGMSKMGMCAKQWKALGSGQAAYDTKATSMKSKKGNKVSGYNVFTGECMKKKA